MAMKLLDILNEIKVKSGRNNLPFDIKWVIKTLADSRRLSESDIEFIGYTEQGDDDSEDIKRIRGPLRYFDLFFHMTYYSSYQGFLDEDYYYHLYISYDSETDNTKILEGQTIDPSFIDFDRLIKEIKVARSEASDWEGIIPILDRNGGKFDQIFAYNREEIKTPNGPSHLLTLLVAKDVKYKEGITELPEYIVTLRLELIWNPAFNEYEFYSGGIFNLGLIKISNLLKDEKYGFTPLNQDKFEWMDTVLMEIKAVAASNVDWNDPKFNYIFSFGDVKKSDIMAYRFRTEDIGEATEDIREVIDILFFEGYYGKGMICRSNTYVYDKKLNTYRGLRGGYKKLDKGDLTNLYLDRGYTLVDQSLDDVSPYVKQAIRNG